MSWRYVPGGLPAANTPFPGTPGLQGTQSAHTSALFDHSGGRKGVHFGGGGGDDEGGERSTPLKRQNSKMDRIATWVMSGGLTKIYTSSTGRFIGGAH